MTLDELVNLKIVTEDSEGLKITEYPEKGYTIIESPKRVEHIRITTIPKFGHCKILYESGKSIPELEGVYTSMTAALRKVKEFLNSASQTPEAKYKERWGDKPIPELKRKRVKKDASSDNENVNVT